MKPAQFKMDNENKSMEIPDAAPESEAQTADTMPESVSTPADRSAESETVNTYRAPQVAEPQAVPSTVYYPPYAAPYAPAYMPQPAQTVHPPMYAYPTYPTPAVKETAEEHPEKRESRKEKPKGGGKGITALTLVFALILSVCAGFAAGWGGMMLYANKTAADPASADPADGGERSFAPSVIYQNVQSGDVPAQDGSVQSVANAVQNSVVAISTETVQTHAFLGQYVTSGAGSGVIMTEDGYIATNNHVVDGASAFTVTLNDGTTYKAELIGCDEETDLAVLKIDATGLTPIIFGNSDSVSVGQTVIAIGNPLGTLGGSVTSGIISALERSVTVEGRKMKLMQTDTAVNPGNSGGGLFNMKGELIGIINAKSYGDAIEGIGFAIPSKTAEKSIVELMEFGYVRGRVDLGLEVIDINSAIAAAYYRVNTLGCYIIKSAYTDELKQGDRITAINGTEVSSYSDITAMMPDFSVGDTVTITVSREGKLIDVEVECHEKNAGKGDINFHT